MRLFPHRVSELGGDRTLPLDHQGKRLSPQFFRVPALQHPVAEPEGYSQEALEAVRGGDEGDAEAHGAAVGGHSPVNLIVIMNESFPISRRPWSETNEDPMPFLHGLRRRTR